MYSPRHELMTDGTSTYHPHDDSINSVMMIALQNFKVKHIVVTVRIPSPVLRCLAHCQANPAARFNFPSPYPGRPMSSRSPRHRSLTPSPPSPQSQYPGITDTELMHRATPTAWAAIQPSTSPASHPSRPPPRSSAFSAPAPPSPGPSSPRTGLPRWTSSSRRTSCSK